MTFNDIFKSSFLEKVSSFSVLDTLIALALALALGLFIFLVYRKSFSGVMYSSSFGIALMAMTLITTLIILAVTSNVILSLGMVGALSIVRFRTAVKEPLDIAFLFWSISAGIVLGAGLIPLAILGSLFIGLVLYFFANRKGGETPYILVVSCKDDNAEKAVMDTVSGAVRKYLIKSKTVTPAAVELTMEVRLKENTSQFVNKVASLSGVDSASLVTYNGEYMS